MPWNLDYDPWVSWSFFLLSNNHQAVNKMKIYHYYMITILYNYIIIILYDNAILDIDHSSYYIALGSQQTHKVI